MSAIHHTAKHTPGPWRAVVAVGNSNGWKQANQQVEIVGDGYIIAHYSTEFAEYADDTTNEANASLIAAAPELLEALQAYVLMTDAPPAIEQKAREAIAKATKEPA